MSVIEFYTGEKGLGLHTYVSPLRVSPAEAVEAKQPYISASPTQVGEVLNASEAEGEIATDNVNDT